MLVEALAEQQAELCFWCLQPLAGTIQATTGRLYVARPQVDHVIPRAFGRREGIANKVASCSICNLIKSSRVFSSIEEGRFVINAERARRGLPFANFGPPPQPASSDPTFCNVFEPLRRANPCPECGGPVVQLTRRGLPKIYCSARCRNRAWELKHPRKKRQPAQPPKPAGQPQLVAAMVRGLLAVPVR